MMDERIVAHEPIVARPELGGRHQRNPAEQALRRPRGYHKVMPRGVSEDGQPDRDLRSWWRGLGILALLGTFGAGIYFGAEPLRELLERPLTSVAVEGEFLHVSKVRTMELISAELNEDFLQLDLMHLKAVLESDPWVEYAALGRRWPDTLVVKIVEQKPIARWGEQGFMNQRGEIITVADTSQLAALPWLQGETADAEAILRQYQDVSRLLRTRGLEVVALKSDAKKSWRLTLRGDVALVIGRDQVMEKVRRFMAVYDRHLRERWSEVRTLDLRYTNGVAVEWQPESTANDDLLNPAR